MHARPARLRPEVTDAAVVGTVAVVALAGLLVPPLVGVTGWGRVGAVPVLLALVQAGALWWRRRRPLVVVAVTLAAVVVGQVVGDENAASFFGPHAAVYAAAAVAGRRDVLALGLVAVAAAVQLVVGWLVPGAPAGVLLSSSGVLVVAAWGIGRYTRMRRAYVEALVSYAHRLEAERDEQARQAVREERRRIARELHDQVAHHLGVVALQTGAARRWLQRDPERAGDALANVEHAVRTALTTMPVILEALRADGPAEMGPVCGLPDVDDLVAEVRAAGLPVELTVEGDRRPVEPSVGSTAYRIVQEALTNTMKHAGSARATVTLRYASDHLGVEVRDDGHGIASAQDTPGGFGLVGMRERVDLLGGDLVSGPREGGGFAVRARLPLQRQQVRA